MFQIRARARAPLFGAPARALVRTSNGGSTSAFVFRHHPHFQSKITVTQSHSEKLSSDCCSNSLWIRPAHFLGGIASTLAGKRQVDEIRSPGSVRSMKFAGREASGSKKIKRSQLTSTSELKTTLLAKRCSKTIPMRDLVISHDLQHRVRNKENIRGPTSRPLIRSMIHVRPGPHASDLIEACHRGSDH